MVNRVTLSYFLSKNFFSFLWGKVARTVMLESGVSETVRRAPYRRICHDIFIKVYRFLAKIFLLK